jgi:hypothetical protein
VIDFSNDYSSAKCSLSVSWERILTQEMQLSHSRYHYTTGHIKSSNHILSLHWPTSNSVSTKNFPWLISTLQSNSPKCILASNVKIIRRHGPRTENTCHVFAISTVHWRAGCCLQKTRCVTATHWCGDVIAPVRKCFYRADA